MAAGSTKPTYFPPTPAIPRRRRRRRCCCSLLVALLSLTALLAVAGGILYAVFRPQRPTFQISAVRLSPLEISAVDLLTSRLNFSLTARNPNRRVTYLYDQISIHVSSNGVAIGGGASAFPGFVHGAKKTAVMTSSALTAADLRKRSVPLEIDLETRVGIEVGGLKTKKVGIRVYCDGIRVAPSKDTVTATGTVTVTEETADAVPGRDCEVKLRMKIWKWRI